MGSDDYLPKPAMIFLVRLNPIILTLNSLG